MSHILPSSELHHLPEIKIRCWCFVGVSQPGAGILVSRSVRLLPRRRGKKFLPRDWHHIWGLSQASNEHLVCRTSSVLCIVLYCTLYTPLSWSRQSFSSLYDQNILMSSITLDLDVSGHLHSVYRPDTRHETERETHKLQSFYQTLLWALSYTCIINSNILR